MPNGAALVLPALLGQGEGTASGQPARLRVLPCCGMPIVTLLALASAWHPHPRADDILVVSVGEQPATFGTPGVEENCFFMKASGGIRRGAGLWGRLKRGAREWPAGVAAGRGMEE